MTAGDLAVVLASVLLVIGFAALIVVLLRVLDMLRALRTEVAELRHETRPLLADLRNSVDDARDDLERFDRVLGSAEAISDAVSGTSRVAKVAFSTPVIKTIALATGTRRAARRMRGATEESGRRDGRTLAAARGARGEIAVASDSSRRQRS